MKGLHLHLTQGKNETIEHPFLSLKSTKSVLIGDFVIEGFIKGSFILAENPELFSIQGVRLEKVEAAGILFKVKNPLRVSIEEVSVSQNTFLGENSKLVMIDSCQEFSSIEFKGVSFGNGTRLSGEIISLTPGSQVDSFKAKDILITDSVYSDGSLFNLSSTSVNSLTLEAVKVSKVNVFNSKGVIRSA